MPRASPTRNVFLDRPRFPYPPASYQIQIIRTDPANSIDVSDASNAFQIVAPVHTYYVSTAGSDAANGLTAETAKPSIAAILQSYTLVPGDTILVAAG